MILSITFSLAFAITFELIFYYSYQRPKTGINHFYIWFFPILTVFLGLLVYIIVNAVKIHNIISINRDYKKFPKKTRFILLVPISIIIGFLPYYMSMIVVILKPQNGEALRNYLKICFILNSTSDIIDFVVYVYLLGNFWFKYSIFRRCLRNCISKEG